MNDAEKTLDNNANQIETISQPSTPNGKQKSWLYAMYFFGLLSLLCLAILFYFSYKVTNYISGVNELELYSGSMVLDANNAVFSVNADERESAYQKLETDMAKYEQILNKVQSSALDGKQLYSKLGRQWESVKTDAQPILDSRSNFNNLSESTDKVNTAVADIQSLYITATQQAINAGLNAEQISLIQEQLIVSEKIAETFSRLSYSISTSSEELRAATSTFFDNLNKQKEVYGGYVPALVQIEETFNTVIVPKAQEVVNKGTSVVDYRQKTQAISRLAADTQQQLTTINRNPLTRPRVLVPAIGFLISLLMFLLSLYQLSRVKNRSDRLLIEKETLRQRQDMEVESDRARKIQEENERNQMAILRLLDELGDLAEGDLTVNATVSEDFTGAIADSVNFAIDQLRQLVLAINTTAVRVAQSSEQTQMTAVELAEASEHQAQEIAGVSAAINEMAVSIDQVSSNATESAAVAQRSVAIAHNGAEVVQRSIEGMNTIREQIQETSKRIKRLGESSQEIGDIIGLINDIADQTNVLALNAAIQASMAGEAGRGFAVVADEVQRLAERSANATKQIESLVKTIQADTNEAVMSMESTTTEVVRGASLAKDAGEALEEVQLVSSTLADLIQNISNAAQQQASSAGHISKTMNVIQDITSQTSSGTLATARSVGQLNEMAASLQESVSDFKLDDDDEVLLQDL